MNYKKINYRNKRGISIVETVIYLAIFTVMSILVINSFIIILSSVGVINTNHDLVSSAASSMDRMSLEIRQAKSIDAINSSSSVLVLKGTDSSEGIKFIKEGNNLNIYKSTDGGTSWTLVGDLLVENVSLDSILFTRITTLNSEGVKIQMTLEDTHSKTNKTKNFYNTVIVRGGY